MSDKRAGAEASVPTYEDFVAGSRPNRSRPSFPAVWSAGSTPASNAAIGMRSRPVALFWESKDGRSARVHLPELKERSARLANLLQARGVRPGDRVAGCCRASELLVVILGTWRVGAVYQPLFTAFGPKAIESRRLQRGAADLHRPAEPAQAGGGRGLSADRYRRRRRRRGVRPGRRLRSGAGCDSRRRSSR